MSPKKVTKACHPRTAFYNTQGISVSPRHIEVQEEVGAFSLKAFVKEKKKRETHICQRLFPL